METNKQPIVDITEIVDSGNDSTQKSTVQDISQDSAKYDKSHSDIDTSTVASTRDPELSNSKSESKKPKDTDFETKISIQKTNDGLSDVKLPTSFKIWLSGFFHIFFKLCNIVSYQVLGLFFSQMFVFITVTVFAVCDFWVVKNVTGRMLLGMRWWTTIDEDGLEKWFFESYNFDFQKEQEAQSNIFWPAQILCTLFWVVMLFLKIITFTLLWSCLATICLTQTGLNLYGYYKCSKDQKKKMANLMEKLDTAKKSASLRFGTEMLYNIKEGVFGK